MIFVTVGTHEQPFDRLLREIDRLVETGVINEEVVVQSGFSEYEPKHCKWQKLFPYSEMTENVKKARIVITHGGPSSFIMPLQVGKIPIVVPRQKQYGEHVNDHQLDFAKAVAERQGNIILAEDISKLGEIISGYDNIIANMPAEMQSNNANFIEKLEHAVSELFGDDN